MTHLDLQIRTAQRRLWLIRGVSYVCVCAAWGAGTFALIVLLQRLFGWALPLLWIGCSLGGAALLATAAWTYIRRESAMQAATALDGAAGLRERLSSGYLCRGVDDAFAQAVVNDAERYSSSVTPRNHLRMRVPRALSPACGLIVLSATTFLLSPGLLKRADQVEAAQKAEQVEQSKAVVVKKLEEVRRFIDDAPLPDELKDELTSLDPQSGGQLMRPEAIRTEALKKLDNLADTIKQKRNESNYDAVDEMRKMLRGLEVPKNQDAPTEKLTKALAQADFKTAREEIEAIKEQLATLKSEDDKAMAEKLSQQLDELAKQIDKLSADEKLSKALEEAGIKPEDLQRMLDSLSKKDLDQLKKQLKEKGMNPQQAEKLAKQLEQKQDAGSLGKQLAQAMKQASQGAKDGQAGESQAGLTQAGQQLSELEQMEQEAAQLESTLQALQDAKDELGKPCSKCNGTGREGDKQCSKCNGSGSEPGDKPGSGGGMGDKGRGRGGKAPEEKTDVDYKVERQKVHTHKGAIVGQFQVDGEQVKGEVNREFVEVVAAAEREASDRIKRDRIPRQYHDAIKAYFTDMQKSIDKNGKPKSKGPEPAAAGGEPRQEKSEDAAVKGD